MNKTTLLLLLFLLLAGTAAYFYGSSNDKSSLQSDSNFSVKNTDQIHRIFMADRTGKRVDLVRKGDHWIYNKKYKARQNAVDNILETLRRVKVLFAPARALEKNMIADLAANGIHIQLFDKAGKIIKDFYVGGVTSDETGTYMMMADGERPYVTHMNGFEGGLRVRFLLKEKDLRDRTVFAEKKENIQSISIEYPKQKNRSFILFRNGDTFEVKPFYDTTPLVNRPLKKGMIEAFLIGFENLQAESFENDSPIRDSISQQLPFSIITVKRKDGTEKTVRLHAFEFGKINDANPKEKNPFGKNQMTIERYLADLSTGDFMLTQHRLFKKILWGYDFFYENGTH